MPDSPLVPWTAADFLIHGEFCPIDEILPAIERARRTAGAKAALLLVADDWAVLRTLCGCVADDDPRALRLSKLLETVSLLPPGKKRRRSSALQDYIRSPRRPGGGGKRFPFTINQILHTLAGIARKAGEKDLAIWLSEGVPSWMPARLPDEACGARINTALIFYEARKGLDEEQGLPLVAVDGHLIDILARVSSTAHANVRRDDLIMKRLDQKLDPALYIAGSIDFKAAAKALVDLAVEISGSNAGACYLVDHSKESFELKASHMTREFERKWSYPEEFSTDSRALGAVATDEHLTLQLPPGMAGRAIHTTGVARAGTFTDRIELATPLPGPLATPKAPAVGVLTLAKLRNPGAPYGAYEIAVLRNVALRLALVATTTNTTQAAEMFARLSMRAARLTISPSIEQEEPSPAQIVVLPDDVSAALPAIEDALSTLGSVTHSGTATFRVALPIEAWESSHGLTLARVAAYPPELAGDIEYALQPETERGYNWSAVRSGQIINKPEVDPIDPEYSAHREKTRSELSVPVYVEDRVVGVVNLESPVEHAFDGHVEIAQAAAEHIGLAVANARLALSAIVQEQATDILREAHDITHLPDELREEVEKIDVLSQQDADRLTTSVEGIQREVDRLRLVSLDGMSLLPRHRDLTFPALVNHVLEKKEMSKSTSVKRLDRDWWPHEPYAAVAIAKALGDIMDNARNHRAKGAAPPEVELRHDVWGGQVQDVLTVRSEPDTVRMLAQAINVYRCPLNQLEFDEGEDVDIGDIQLGSYLAGLLIRRAGGEVHLIYGDGPQARVTVAVPAPSSPKPAKGDVDD